MMYRPQRILTGAAAVTATALLASSGIAFAQEESPDPAMTNGEAVSAQAYPLHIHEGNCEQLGNVVYPLGEISTDLNVHGEALGGAEGQEDRMVALNVTLVAASLDDLTGAEHAISIHQSEEDLANIIACGEISGSFFDGGTLVIRLNEANDSGFIGFALFREDPEAVEGDEEIDTATAVYSMLTEKDAGMVSPTMVSTTDEPAMSPAPEDGMSPAPEDGMSPAPEDGMSPAPEDGMSPAPEDEATTDDTTTVTIEVEGDAEVQVDEEPQESPAA
jgi:hypothetical protein